MAIIMGLGLLFYILLGFRLGMCPSLCLICRPGKSGAFLARPLGLGDRILRLGWRV